MRPSETEISNPEQTRMGGSGLGFLLYPTGTFFSRLVKVKAMVKGARADTIPTKSPSSHLSGAPTGDPQTS